MLMNTINPQLVEWLKKNSNGNRVVLPAYDTEYMAIEARLHNLIEFESVDYSDATVRCRLTDSGEYHLGIGNGAVVINEEGNDSIPATEEPPQASERYE